MHFFPSPRLRFSKKFKLLIQKHRFTMLKVRMWFGVASGAALLLAPMWVLFLTQVHISFLNARLAQVQRQVEESDVINREFTAAYIQSKIHPDVRLYYSYSWTEVSKLNQLNQEDPEVINHIKKRLLIPPPQNPPKQPQADTSKGHSEKILNHFKNMTGGFFVECGAMDGTFLSNTLLLEAKYGWTGLLIEAEPNNFQKLLTKKRNVWALPTCLSLKKSPSTVHFTNQGAWAKISDKGLEVHCMPLFSILQSINRTTIDFFSLDIEGNELDVLRTVPFDKVDIKTLAVEHSNIKEGREHLLEFILNNGYYEHPSTPEEHINDNWAQEDYIFIKK